jgi:hypothetical protein
MTEEEMLAIQAYLMQTDPMARATNDYGQGAGFLGLDSQPESWDRVGEKNDLYADLFRTTRTYLPDYVEGLYPEVEDPGLYKGYKSDKADLYRNNPAYAQIESAMAEGASFDEAVRLVAGNKEFAQFLPQDDNGRPDAQSFRTSAEGYVSERSREGREFDAFDAEKLAYDDYVRPRTGLDFAPVRNDDISSLLKPSVPGIKLGTIADPGPRRPTVPASLSGDIYNGLYDEQGINPDKINVVNQSSKGRKVTQSRTAGPQSTQNKGQANAARDRVAQQGNVDLYNKMVKQAYNKTVGNKERVKVGSKKQENQAKLVRAYNMLMYGE